MEEAGGGLAIVAEEGGSDDLATQAPDGSTRCHINCYDCDVTPPSPPPVKTPPSSPCTPCGGRKRGGGGDELFREEPDGDRIAHFFVPLTSHMMGEAIGAKKCSMSEYSISPVQVQARAYKEGYGRGIEKEVWTTHVHPTPRTLIG